MAEENLKSPIGDMQARHVLKARLINVFYGSDGSKCERFVCTSIGRIRYLVSIDYGFSYTRPQFIEKYSKVNAQFEIAAELD